MKVRVAASFVLAATFAIATTSAAYASDTLFHFTNGPQSYTVPAGVHVLKVTARGAGGAGTGRHHGARGARVESYVAVVPGQVLRVDVGSGGIARSTHTSGEGSGVFGTGVRVLAGGGVWRGTEISYGNRGVDSLPPAQISRTGGHGGAKGQDGRNGTVLIATTKRSAHIDRPRLDDVWPYVGSHSGGIEVHLTGKGLHRVTKVLFDGVPGRDVLWLGGDELTVIAPKHRAGIVPITLVSIGGRERTPAAFVYR